MKTRFLYGYISLGLGAMVLLALIVLRSGPTIPQSTVMITNLTQTSGGSGSIISSTEVSSTVLTNRHVCEVVRSGGVVVTSDDIHPVVSYIESSIHDLCLITVHANLHVNTYVSDTPPATYTDCTVAGHPHLLPTIITTGHFSSKRLVQVLTGYRECSEAERMDPSTAMFCSILGRVPLIRTFEAIVVSATIQPGSSGSAVYNSAHEISAVIFAGAGDLGYGLAVPLEYVYNFLNVEASTLEVRVPNMILQFANNEPTSKAVAEEVKNLCETFQIRSPICSDLKNYVILD